MIDKLGLGSLIVFIAIHHLAFAGIAYEDDYYENYYDDASGESYKEFVEPSTNTDTDVQNSNSQELIKANIKVQCSQEHLTLIVARRFLPNGLSLHAPSNSQRSTRTCFELHRNRTAITYKVTFLCENLVSTTKIGPKLFYRHEALFVRKGTSVSRSNPYAIVYTLMMECEQHGIDNGNGTYIFPPDAHFRPERRLFEHRISVGAGSTCRRSGCPYSDLCLPDDEVDGYYCVCASSSGCKLSCPTDYYGCARENKTVSQTALRCIKTGWLCDQRIDCKLQDDEASCREIWSAWGSWSPCSSKCGSGVQRRHRTCDVSFTRDPQKCKLYEDALGCSRRCTNNTEIEMVSRTCTGKGCFHVTCNHDQMIVVIPREPGMTGKVIQTKMLMGGDPTCKPKYNSSHVLFTTKLHKCNTSSKVEGKVVTYSNEITYLPNEEVSSVIMRDMPHSYSVECRFNRRRKVTFKNPVNKLKNHEIAILSFDSNDEAEWRELGEKKAIEHSATGSGQFDFKMMLYKGSNFTQPYQASDYPLQKQLHELLYVAIHFFTTDSDLTLMIDRCMATPTKSNSRSQYIYDFINSGCSVDKTVEMYIGDDNPKSARFSIETFKFVDSSMTDIYFQCDVTVCDIIDKNCRPPCNQTASGKRRRRRRSALSIPNRNVNGHVIVGPIRITEKRLQESVAVNEKIQIDRFIPPKQYKILATERKQTESSEISSSYLVIAIIGGIACMLIGTFAGITISRKYRKTPNWV